MARRVRDAMLETRTARGKLKARGKPYYRSLAPGLHIGYRKNAGGGRWVARIYIGKQNYHVEAFADADDVVDANGTSILDFWQAQQRAREMKAELDRPAPWPTPAAHDRRQRRRRLHRQARRPRHAARRAGGPLRRLAAVVAISSSGSRARPQAAGRRRRRWPPWRCPPDESRPEGVARRFPAR